MVFSVSSIYLSIYLFYILLYETISQVHLLIYIAPICIKFQCVPYLLHLNGHLISLFRYDPLYAAFLLVGVLSTFKAYPTLSDPGLFLSMIAVFPEIYPCVFSIVTIIVHTHSINPRLPTSNCHGASPSARISLDADV